MAKENKAPTMKDVAREAGVALGTVSKVFNGLPVGEKYRARVLEAAGRLGYQVNEYARGLRASRTCTVALVLPTITHPFYSSLADYCCEILQRQGYRMLIATTSYDQTAEQKCIDMVQQNKVDGIIAITYNPNLEVGEELPFVIIDRKFHAKVPCVSSDNFSGGQLAAEKLVENGCKRLLFLGNSSSVPGEVDKRVLGFEDYCTKHHIAHEIYRTFDDEITESIFSYVNQHITGTSFPFDGIFCITDVLAYQILKILRANHIRVPEDVQVIGFDGVKQFGSEEEYYCSTIRQPLYEMAETAVNLLLHTDRKSLPSLVCLPVSYCYGGTTKS